MGSTKSKAQILKDEANQYRMEYRVATIGLPGCGKTTIARKICKYNQNKSNVIRADYNFSEFTIREHVPNVDSYNISKHSSKHKQYIDWIVNKPTNLYNSFDIEYCKQMIKTYAENHVPQFYFDEKIICKRYMNQCENNLNISVPEQICEIICRYYQMRWIVNSYKTLEKKVRDVLTTKVFELYDLSNIPFNKCSLLYGRMNKFIYVLDISNYDEFYEINEIDGNKKRINKLTFALNFLKTQNNIIYSQRGYSKGKNVLLLNKRDLFYEKLVVKQIPLSICDKFYYDKFDLEEAVSLIKKQFMLDNRYYYGEEHHVQVIEALSEISNVLSTFW